VRHRAAGRKVDRQRGEVRRLRELAHARLDRKPELWLKVARTLADRVESDEAQPAES